MRYLNIAAYQFVDLPKERLPLLQQRLREETTQRKLKGTILLSAEGINLFLAGELELIRSLQQFFLEHMPFLKLSYRESWCATLPFKRMSVRIKAEIIALGQKAVKPAKKTAPYITPQELKQWYDQGREMVVLDTRNEYEYNFGSFANALQLKIRHFRHFPTAVQQLPETMKHKPIVTFCTGGIRCEKAATFMQQQGFTDVYQLQGGILHYFEQCGGEHFHGDCFVFDNRVAVNAELAETAMTHCSVCQAPVTQTCNVCPGCNGAVREKELNDGQ